MHITQLTLMVSVTSTSDRSDTSVLPCVTLGCPSGPAC